VHEHQFSERNFSTPQLFNHSTAGMLIINADDWGRSVLETDGALNCFKERRITRVSAMVFMQDSRRAAKLAAQQAISAGLHLNFSEQFTHPKCPERLQESQDRIAKFLKRNKYAQVIYNPLLHKAFTNSFRAQWHEFIRLYHKPPTHLDGHHHMHLCANVLFSKLFPAGMQVRRNFSFLPSEKSWLNRFYRQAVDRRLARNYTVTDYFFDLTACIEKRKMDRVMRLARSNSVELMTHPIIRRETDYLMSDEFWGILQQLDMGERALV
jgi:predicted glycoside hydrolase/deacetylase ChbG (UPF0249 family)